MLRSVKYGMYGAVLAGLVAAPVVWNSIDKEIRLTVDGRPTTVHTSADTVGALLADKKMAADEHDIVAPATDTKVKDGMHVVLKRGRLLHLSIDGKPAQVWTTAPTVAQAMRELGYSASDFVSVSRSKRLPLSPSALQVRTPRLVTVVHDGKRETVSTTQPTVDTLLREMRLARDADDRLSVPATTATANGQVLTLQRVSTSNVTRLVKVEYATTKQNDKKLDKGSTKVITEGRNGKAQVTYAITLIDGKHAASRPVKTVTVTAARTQIVAVGTKKVVAKAGDPDSAKAFARMYMQQKYDWGEDEFGCLEKLWKHESGWRSNAENKSSGAYGIPQSLPGSKMSVIADDWRTNPETQVKWGLKYIKGRYGTPCETWSFWQANNHY